MFDMRHYYDPYELYHHGVKGQKWGVRRNVANITAGNGNIHRRGEGLGTGNVGQGGRPVSTGPSIAPGGYAKPPESISVTVSSGGGHHLLTSGQHKALEQHLHQMAASPYSEFRRKYQAQIDNGKKKTESFLKKAVSALINGVKKILGFIKSLFSPKK